MPNLFAMLGTGRTALMSEQRAISVTGHNVSNVYTEGYTRQVPIFSAENPYEDGKFWAGAGVKIDQFKRMADNFLDRKIKLETGEKSLWEGLDSVASDLEVVFNENKDVGIRKSLDAFWDQWQNLANNPEELVARDGVVQAGQTLVNTIRESHDAVEAVADEKSKQIESWVDEVNTLSDEVVKLNKTIKADETGGRDANDLRDKLNMKLTRLAELVGGNVEMNKESNTFTLFLSNGATLVDDKSAHHIEFKEGEFTQSLIRRLNGKVALDEVATQKDWYTLKIDGEDVSLSLGGKIGGVVQGVTTLLQDVADRLNNFTKEMIYQVNKLHASGVGMNPITNLEGETTLGDTSVPLRKMTSLPFLDRLKSGGFEINVFDENNNVVSSTIINVDKENSFDAVVNQMDQINHLHASVSPGGKLIVYSDGGYSFSFSNDSSDFLVNVGMNAFFSGTDSSNIAVSSRITSDTSTVAAGADLNSGDNSIALKIANLKQEQVMENGHLTLNGYYDSLVSDLGSKSGKVKDMVDTHTQILQQLQQKRDGLSGVNIDEEMTKMMQFQRAYQAAARFITTIDAMTDKVVNGMGLVGR